MQNLNVDFNEEFTITVAQNRCRFEMIKDIDSNQIKIRFKMMHTMGEEPTKEDGHVPFLDWFSGRNPRSPTISLWRDIDGRESE